MSSTGQPPPDPNGAWPWAHLQSQPMWATDPRAYAGRHAANDNGGNGRGWGDITKSSVPLVLAISMLGGAVYFAWNAGALWTQTMGRLEGIEAAQKGVDKRLGGIESTLERIITRTGWGAEVKRN
jgi:hypothetical protein